MGKAGNHIMKSCLTLREKIMPLRRIMRRIGFICLLSGVCFSIPTSLPMPHAATSRDIHIGAQPPFFSPNQLTISIGTPLTWRNRTREPHTIVSDDCRRGSTCSFESGFLGPNARYTLPQLKPGRYIPITAAFTLSCAASSPSIPHNNHSPHRTYKQKSDLNAYSEDQICNTT